MAMLHCARPSAQRTGCILFRAPAVDMNRLIRRFAFEVGPVGVAP